MLDSKFKILMVDDSIKHHEVFGREISDTTGATVEFAVDGEEALKKLSDPENHPDLVLLDLSLPKIGGEEVLKTIREHNRFDHLPVIILTGETNQEVQSKLLNVGADDFIEKGCSAELFISRLKAQIRHKLTLDKLMQMALDMDVFTAGVLHDIKNVETSIISLCDIIYMLVEEDPEKNKTQVFQELKNLKAQVARIDEYASGVIQQVRMTRRQTNPCPQNLEKIFDWAMAILGEEKMSITWESPEPLKNVLGDEHFLRLAAFNIFQNAIKYSRPNVVPKIIITQTFSDSLASKGAKKIITKLRDNGQGISPDELKKIFRPFVRGKSSTKTTEGFGLGLSLVAKALTNMGGRVWAEPPNDNNPGTVFCIELPSA